MNDLKTIFLVDDDPFITKIVVKCFSAKGYRLLAFDYGEDCLKALNKSPDLIILDYIFQNYGQKVMNGMEVFDKIKEVNPDVPVIMLSGQDRGDLVLEFAKKGVDDYVIKDNSLIDNLNFRIKELLGQGL